MWSEKERTAIPRIFRDSCGLVSGFSDCKYQLHTDNMSYRGGRGGGRGGRGGFNGGRRDFDEGPPERVVGGLLISDLYTQRWDT